MQAFMQLPGRGNLTWQREKKLRDALKGAVAVLKEQLEVIIKSYATEWMEGLPVASSLSADGIRLAAPLQKAIAAAEAALELQKKAVDTDGAA
jgi:hypothetical protein